MRFPMSFQRRHGGAGPIKQFSDDVIPTTTPPGPGNDNVLSCRLWNLNGWPVQRIVVGYVASAGIMDAPTADLYMWEETLGAWLKLNGSSVTLTQNGVAYFDVPTIAEPAPVQKNLTSPSAGSLDVMIIIAATDDATYTFAMAPDVTTIGT
jgi:hypothetical protein